MSGAESILIGEDSIMSFYEQMIELWHNIFQGEKKFIFYIGFCMLTFAVPFLSIWIYAGLINLYYYIVLRKKYPEIWNSINMTNKKHGSQFYYKQWLKGEIDINDPFCKIRHRLDIFGKICIGIWITLIFVVGLSALIKNFIH